MQAFAKAGRTFDPKNIIYMPSISTIMSQKSKTWDSIIGKLIEEVEFDGIVAFSDQVALKALYFMRKLGFDRIPIHEIPVVGFDNTMESLPLPFQLSSVGHDKDDIAFIAPDILFQMLQGETFPQHRILDVRLYSYN